MDLYEFNGMGAAARRKRQSEHAVQVLPIIEWMREQGEAA